MELHAVFIKLQEQFQAASDYISLGHASNKN